jgi:hypothetical protein
MLADEGIFSKGQLLKAATSSQDDTFSGAIANVTYI